MLIVINPCYLCCCISIRTGITLITALSLVVGSISGIAVTTSFIICKLQYYQEQSMNESKIILGIGSQWDFHLTQIDAKCYAWKEYAYTLGGKLIINIILWFGIRQNRVHFVVVVLFLEIFSLFLLILMFLISGVGYPMVEYPFLIFCIYKTWVTFAYLVFIYKERRKKSQDGHFLTELLSQLSTAVEIDVHQQDNKKSFPRTSSVPEHKFQESCACSNPSSTSHFFYDINN